MADRLPLTVLSGFFGAGKTALRDYLLAHAAGRRIAVIVNALVPTEPPASGDTEAGIDSGANTGADVLELANGCICCTLRDDMLAEAGKLARAGRFDQLVIESNGVAEPLQIAEAFEFEDEHGGARDGATRLDTLVTVVDASRFLQDLNDADFLQDRQQARDEDDDRTTGDVLIEQVECADVIVLNKTDLVDADTRDRLLDVLAALNPRADLIPATHAQVPPGRVLRTNRFDFDATTSAPGWQAALRGDPAAPGTAGAADGANPVSHFVYRRRKPFHPQRFGALAHGEWLRKHGMVLRSKGFFWLASRMDVAGSWSQAGGVCRHGGAGAWWADIDRADWPTDAESVADIEADFLVDGQPAPFGDRRQELVLIGLDLDRAALEAALDACLLDDAEMAAGAQAWARYDDPFPDWADDHDHDHDHDHEHEHEHEHGHPHVHGHAHDHGHGDCDCPPQERTQDRDL